MRIDGVSSQSYSIKRKPRKGGVVLDADGELLSNDSEDLSEVAARAEAAGERLANLPARPQDMIFHRSMSNHEQKCRHGPCQLPDHCRFRRVGHGSVGARPAYLI